MATMANFFGRWAAGQDASAQAAVRNEAGSGAGAQGADDVSRLPPLPNERLYFYSKRIDNSAVVREADPKARRVCWQAIGGSGMAALLLVGLLLPGAYRYMAGYQVSRLKEEQKQLRGQVQSLELEEARLLTLERMNELARQRQFSDPAPGKLQYLNADDTVARIR